MVLKCMKYMLPDESMHKLHALYRPMTCVNYAFCIVILSSYLSFVSCMNFTKFSPLWDQYTDSIVNPLAYLPVWCCACCFVRFDLLVNNLPHLVSVSCSLYSQWAKFLYFVCQSFNILAVFFAIKWTEI